MEQKPKQYGFKERIGFSRGVSKTGNIEEILLDNIPGAFSISRASSEEDRHGTDFWVSRINTLPKLSIDLKARETDPLSFDPPKDDLALETYSNVAKKTKGWTRDEHKRTDYILWFFEPTSRWVLVPFPMLCKVFSEKWMEWRARYQTETQKTTHDNETWYSECVFVPRVVVWREIYKRYGGKGVGKPDEEHKDGEEEFTQLDHLHSTQHVYPPLKPMKRCWCCQKNAMKEAPELGRGWFRCQECGATGVK